MNISEFKKYLEGAFEEMSAALPYVKFEWDIEWNKRRRRWEVTYLVSGKDKKGYGGVYVKPEQLEDDMYMETIVKTFTPNMIKKTREYFGVILTA